MLQSHDPVLRATELSLSVGDGAFRVGPVSLVIPRGAAVGIVGETGSGKSLLCRTLVGMLEFAGGHIEGGTLEVAGADVTRADRARWTALRRRTVGYMPQSSMSGLNPVRRIGSQLVELLPGGRDERRPRSVALMEQVRMRDPERVLRSFPHELSGGMRQRVMLAFALIGDPQLLVADEPTTALDPTIESDVLDLIRRVQAEREMSMAIVSHDMRVIRRMCSWVVVMHRGRMVESGEVAQVLREPAHPYTRALLGADPALAQRKTMLATLDHGDHEASATTPEEFA